MAMSSVPRPDDPRRVTPHEETIVGSHSGLESNAGSHSAQSNSAFPSASFHETPGGAPTTADEFAHSLTASGLLSRDELNSFYDTLSNRDELTDAFALAELLIRANKITPYQAETLCQGHTRGLVLGNYVILEKLGEGGMGMVFKARHRLMKRVVALKVLPPSLTQSADAVARFHREVEAAAKLQYANIAGAFDADQADGIHFMVMEYVEGPNLSALVKEVGPLTPALAMNIIAQAAKGLLHAHENGVVHRDIKPGNLLVSKEGVVKILDMGLAQLQSADENSGQKAELTQSGRIMGTVDYMAPEQALDAKTVDQRADIYSLGCTLFYLLAGRPLSPEGTLTQKLLWHQTEPVPALKSVSPEVSDELDAIFQKMVAKKVDERFQTMGDVLQQLEPLLASIPPEELQLPAYGVGLSKDTGSSTDYSGRGKLTLVDRGTRSDLAGTLGWQDSDRPMPTPLPMKRGGDWIKLVLAAACLGVVGVAAGVGIFLWLAHKTNYGNTRTPVVAGGDVQVIVASDQPNARVFVDDEERGQTNGNSPYQLVMKLPAGNYRLRVERDGFAAFEQPLTIQAGQAPLTLQAPLANRPATLALQTAVVGMQVSLDGRPQAIPTGPEPYHLMIPDLAPGDHKLKLSAAGYESQEVALSLTPGEKRELTVELKERPFRAILTLVFRNTDPKAGPSVTVLSPPNGLKTEAASWLDLPTRYDEVVAINLSGSTIGDSDLAALAQLESLESLSLANTGITDAGIKALQPLTKLKKLDLRKTKVSNTALASLERLTELRDLDISQTAVTDICLQSVARLKQLETLRLSDTNIGDEGIKRLVDNRHLKTLSVDGTRVTSDGYDALSTAFKDQNPILKAELDPELGVARKLLRGGVAIAIVPAVATDKPPRRIGTLSELPGEKLRIVGIYNQESNVIDDDLVAQFAGLQRLQEVDLDGSRVTDDGLASLREAKSLRKINLGYLRVSKGAVEALTQDLPGLDNKPAWEGPRDRVAAEWVLKHGGQVMISEGAGQLLGDIAKLPLNHDFRLTEIHLVNSSEVADADLAIFKNLRDLQTLNLVGCSGVSDAGLEHLQGDGNLRTLCLSGDKITSRSLGSIARLFPQLERLYLADTAIAGDELRQLKRLPELARLSLAGANLRDDDLVPLAKLGKLTWLSLDGTPLSDRAVGLLSGMKQLKTLSLDDRQLKPIDNMLDQGELPAVPKRQGMQISDAGLEQLEALLPDCQVLHRDFSPERLALRWVLEQGGSATVIDLANKQQLRVGKAAELPRGACQVTEISLKGCKQLESTGLSALRSCHELIALDLSDTGINSESLAGLAAFPNLTALNLRKTLVDDTAFRYLVGLSNLETLNLSETLVKGETLVRTPLPKLTSLNVSGTDFNDEGLAGVAKSTQLAALNLQYCRAVTDRGIGKLVGLTQLADLNLSGTQVTDAAGSSIAKLSGLRKLSLYKLKIGDAMVSYWKDLPLEDLNVASTGVTDAALEHLANIKTLKTLWVYGTTVSDGGAKALRDRLGDSLKVIKSSDPAQRDENTSGSGRLGGF